MDLNFPHVETVIKVQYKYSAAENNKLEYRYYISSAPLDRYSPKKWLELIRGHWGGIEIRNHWRKDACLFEDKTRSRNPNIVAAFAMLRNVLLFFFNDQKVYSTLTGFVESVAADNTIAFSMLNAR
jgi:predicted transposase YbfD/YdcC